jgi:probable H4MPT-linked C1 transfer pathway protein
MPTSHKRIPGKNTKSMAATTVAPTSLPEPNKRCLGIDIGGANIKLAHVDGWSCSQPFAMWREWENLASALAPLICQCPDFDLVAITMTGELADCFATRADGVALILEQVTRIIPAPLVQVYSVDGRWRSPSQAAREPWMAAASNWHALATWARRFLVSEYGIVVDIGSTTIDLIPICKSGVATPSMTDSQRLRRGELLYTGIERSNIAGVVRSVPLFGKRCPVMNEQFATTRDAYLWLGKLPEEPDDRNTADGKPATIDGARYRLARIVGEDGSTLTDSDITAIAQAIFDKQVSRLKRGIERVVARQVRLEGADKPPCLILSGHGGFLIDTAIRDGKGFSQPVSLLESIGPDLSRCAPAYAVATLASEAVPASDGTP